MELNESLSHVLLSLEDFLPEAMLTAAVLAIVLIGLLPLRQPHRTAVLFSTAFFFLAFALASGIHKLLVFSDKPDHLFSYMLQRDGLTDFLNVLFDIGGLLTVIMTWSWRSSKKLLAEYLAFIVSAVLGAHLFVMSSNLLMAFLSMEIISISSYLLTGFAFNKPAAEGSLKYFLFGATSSAFMLYGFSLLYGLTGSLAFLTPAFHEALAAQGGMLMYGAVFLSLAGFLFKVAAFPMHIWAPDVYEAAPTPVVALFSVVPKLAGLGILTRFTFAMRAHDSMLLDWQLLLCFISLITITVGNFSALRQQNPKRLMAYSSIAQSGFLMIGLVIFSTAGVSLMLFYAAIYLVMNFLVFSCLQHYENQGVTVISDFAGTGMTSAWPMLCLLTGLVSLTGLPPTAGFTGKLFLFSGLWEAYSGSGKGWLLVLLVAGLLHTVIALFYYLRIPFQAFMRTGKLRLTNNFSPENLLWGILVLTLVLLFFQPQLLMGLINKINFVLYQRT